MARILVDLAALRAASVCLAAARWFLRRTAPDAAQELEQCRPVPRWMPADDDPLLGEQWWVIEQDALLVALRAVANGADPDLMLLELDANSQREDT